MSQFSKTSFLYSLLRIYSNFIYRRWFNTIEVNGEGNIPEGEPVIFAPNHQNGLIDAMALLSSSPQPVVFWVRADLFKNKVVGAVLRSLKMMPAYRMRNGIQNLKKNVESIEHSDDVLLNNQFLCLMPEGGQEEQRTLRPLVKGIFRAAFSAQEKMENGKWVRIVPTGIDYGHYDNSGRHLVVTFGKPISIKDYIKSYEENPPVALNQIKEELSNRIEPLMLNIRSAENYETIYAAAYLYNWRMLQEMNIPDNETNRLAARQRIVDILQCAETESSCSELFEELKAVCEGWRNKNKDVAFSAKMQEYEGLDADLIVKVFYLILTLPLQLYSIVMNGLQFLICKAGGKKMRGTGFEASVKFGLAGILLPITYIILTTIFGLSYSPDAMTTLCFAISLPLSFFFFQRYRWKFQYVKERLKIFFTKPKEPKRVESIIDQIRSLLGK